MLLRDRELQVACYHCGDSDAKVDPGLVEDNLVVYPQCGTCRGKVAPYKARKKNCAAADGRRRRADHLDDPAEVERRKSRRVAAPSRDSKFIIRAAVGRRKRKACVLIHCQGG